MRKAGREVDRLDYLRPEQGEEENVGERRLEAQGDKSNAIANRKPREAGMRNVMK